MKNKNFFLIVLAVFVCSFATRAQTVLYSNNFDTCSLGAFLTVSAPQFSTWNGVPGGINDVTITDEMSASAPHAVKWASVNPDGDGDIVWSLENKTSGVYEVEFKILIGDGTTEGGYFNMLQVLPPNAEWAFSLVFLPDSTLGFSWNNAQTIVGNYAKNQWNDIKVKVDLDADSGHLFMNSGLIVEWQWSIQEDGGMGIQQLAGVNFYTYAGGGAGSSVKYYIDDVKFTELISSQIREISTASSLKLWPNPVSDIINVDVEPGSILEVYTPSGKLAGLYILDNGNADISALSSGIYLARIFTGSSIHNIKLVKR